MLAALCLFIFSRALLRAYHGANLDVCYPDVCYPDVWYPDVDRLPGFLGVNAAEMQQQ